MTVFIFPDLISVQNFKFDNKNSKIYCTFDRFNKNIKTNSLIVMIQSNEFLFQNELLTEVTGPGVQRQILGYDNDIMMVKVMFETGSVGPQHSHPHVQTTYVSSGKFEITIGEEKRILSAGDGFYAPANKIHGVVCLEAGILIDVFNPVREDFLRK